MKGVVPLQKEASEKTALSSVIRGMYIQHTIFTRELLFFYTLNGDTLYISFLFLVGNQAKENDSLSQLVESKKLSKKLFLCCFFGGGQMLRWPTSQQQHHLTWGMQLGSILNKK